MLEFQKNKIFLYAYEVKYYIYLYVFGPVRALNICYGHEIKKFEYPFT